MLTIIMANKNIGDGQIQKYFMLTAYFATVTESVVWLDYCMIRITYNNMENNFSCQAH